VGGSGSDGNVFTVRTKSHLPEGRNGSSASASTGVTLRTDDAAMRSRNISTIRGSASAANTCVTVDASRSVK